MDFKSTLNLPDPDFTIPMKAGLPQTEPKIQARWDEIGLYELVQKARQDAPTFLLHDGPPYTNNAIHIGTAFNKILKDFVLKSRMVMGYRVPYVPGFDNHGLPIEQAVMKKFEEKKEHPSKLDLRRACREHAQTYVDLQTTQFRRLGVLGMWDRPYRTMDYGFEAEIVRVFKRMVEAGYVYRGLRPTLWSPTAQTALADTEIVYKTVTSKAIMVRFPLQPGQDNLPAALQGKANVYAVIWTTTPWTIPANLGLAFHPQHEYVVVDVSGDHYIVIKELLANVAKTVGWANPEVVATFTGAEIDRIRFKHPVFDRDSLAMLADYVTTEDGTGVVHTAPGHGRDDFFTGQRYGLPVLCPVDARGVLTDEAGEFAGTHYKKCDVVVVDRLRELGALLSVEDYTHSYPHAERDDQPVIFRATEQWFVSIEHDGLRSRLLEEIDHSIEWFPRSGHTRMRTMMAGRPDWCVSRQRPWGVGIPVFYGEQSGEPVLDPVAIEAVAKHVEEKGSDAWYELDAKDLLPPGYQHPETGETEFRKETDVFDVWFDSGSSSLAVFEGNVEPRWKEDWPADLYFEGSDQHRGWFNLSLILGTATRGASPYRQVATHGFVNDEKGQKMSKRLGNVIDPVDVCNQFGADVLRYWASSVNYEDDVPCSPALLQVAGDGYRRVRNTLRFLLGNLSDFDATEDVDLLELDQWIVEKTDCLVETCTIEFKRYRFNAALSALHNFCVNELSAFYNDAIKDRMYCDGPDWPTRRSAQKACWLVLRKLTLLTAVVMPHTAEEVYAKIPGLAHLDSVYLDALEPVDCVIDSDLHRRVDTLIETRGWVFAQFELWKPSSEVKDSQDVAVTVTLPTETAVCLRSFGPDLPNLFKMADVTVLEGDPHVQFEISPWPKCDRSRLRRADAESVDIDGETVVLTARDRRAIGR